jgi:ribonucleoside-triphosphate reductase
MPEEQTMTKKSKKAIIKSITNNDKNLQDETDITKKNSEHVCPYCGSSDIYGISRIVGYFSIIDNWNKSKKAEFKNRQKGNYWSNTLEE